MSGPHAEKSVGVHTAKEQCGVVTKWVEGTAIGNLGLTSGVRKVLSFPSLRLYFLLHLTTSSFKSLVIQLICPQLKPPQSINFAPRCNVLCLE